MMKVNLPHIAILGAGPVGVEAAVYARTLGYPVTIYEAGQPAEFVNRWGYLKMFTPFAWNITPLGKSILFGEKPKREWPGELDQISGREYRETYLMPLLESALLSDTLHAQTTVMMIGREGWRKSDPVEPKKPLPPFRLLVRDAKGQERFESADLIFDCTGTYGKPNWAGDGGIPAAGEIAARAQISYWPDDLLGAKKDHYAGKSIVLIGGGYSAATTMTQLATLAEDHQSTWVIWLTHGPRGGPLPRVPNDPLKERDRLAVKANSLANRCDSHLEFQAQMHIEELISHGPDKGFRVAGRAAGKPMSWEVERVIANVGYRPDTTIFQELRVGELTGEFTTQEPGYYILGAKSRSRDSQFIMRDGFEQIRKLFQKLSQNKSLDLYTRRAA